MIRELSPGETYLAYAAFLELRPNLGSQDDFVYLMNDVQRLEGYRIAASFVDGEEQAAAATGFRVFHHMSWGHTLYCDDLSCREAFRRQGHASALLDWLEAEALRLGCVQLHLDSGVGPFRADAHRLYTSRGMSITGLHFAKSLR